MIFHLLYFSLEIFNMGIFDLFKRKPQPERVVTLGYPAQPGGQVPKDRGLPRPTITPPMPPVRSPLRPPQPSRHMPGSNRVGPAGGADGTPSDDGTTWMLSRSVTIAPGSGSDCIPSPDSSYSGGSCGGSDSGSSSCGGCD